MGDQLTARRELIEQHVLPKLADPIRYSPVLEASLSGLIRSVNNKASKDWLRNAATANTNQACAPAHG